jgi:hypothetical protein
MTISRLRNVVLRAVVALSLAFLVWLYARSRHQETVDDVQVPVHVGLIDSDPENHLVEIIGPSRVLVSFKGPMGLIRELRSRLQRGEVQASLALTIPAERQNDASYRETLRVEPDDVLTPAGVEATLLEGRNTVQVTVHRLIERRLPVRLETVGESRFGQVHVEPDTVLVRGPQETLEQARSIPTQPYALPAAPDVVPVSDNPVRGEATLVKELDGRPLQCNPATVSFDLRIQPRQRTYELADVPVQFLCPPGCPWRPRFSRPAEGKISVRIVGPLCERPPEVQAFVDLTQGNFAKGRNREPVRLQLPKDFQLATDTPRLVSFVLEPQ